jgi:hypothetical protein
LCYIKIKDNLVERVDVMTSLISDFSLLFSMMWTQLGNAVTWLTGNVVGVIFLFTVIFPIIIWAIAKLVGMLLPHKD